MQTSVERSVVVHKTSLKFVRVIMLNIKIAIVVCTFYVRHLKMPTTVCDLCKSNGPMCAVCSVL